MSTTSTPGRTPRKQRPENLLPSQHDWKLGQSSSAPASSTGYDRPGFPSHFRFSISMVSLRESESTTDLSQSCAGSASSGITLAESSDSQHIPRRPRKLTRRRTQSNAEEPWLVVEGIKGSEEFNKRMREWQQTRRQAPIVIERQAHITSSQRSSIASNSTAPPEKNGLFLPWISSHLKETPLDVHRRMTVRRIVSQPSLNTPKPEPPSPLHIPVVSPSRNHSPRPIAPPSSFRFPSMCVPDDFPTHPSPTRPSSSADVQRILAQPTLLAPTKRPISRCQSAEELSPALSAPSTASSETLVEDTRRPRKLQRPRSRCSSAATFAPPSVAVSTPCDEDDQAWFVLNVVTPGEGWDEDKIRVSTPTEEVTQAVAQAAPPVRSRAQSAFSQSTTSLLSANLAASPARAVLSPPAIEPHYMKVSMLAVRRDSQALAADSTPADRKPMSRCRSWFNLRLPSARRSAKIYSPPSSFRALDARLSTAL